MAYAAIEPFGEFRSELRHGQSMAMTANINRDPDKRREPYKPHEFMNFMEAPPEPKLTPQEISDQLSRILGA